MLFFILLWLYARKPRPMGAVSGAFLLGYGVFRFAAEFAREPDNFLGLLAANLSMGQWLSLPMILIGIAMLVWSYRRAGNGEKTRRTPDAATAQRKSHRTSVAFFMELTRPE